MLEVPRGLAQMATGCGRVYAQFQTQGHGHGRCTVDVENPGRSWRPTSQGLDEEVKKLGLKGGKLKQDLIDQLLRVTFKSSGIQCFCCHGTKDSGLSRFHLSRGEGIAHCFETYLLSCIEVNVQGISST